MHPSEICQSKYDQLVIELRKMLYSNHCSLFSAIVYGSYCRKEIFSVYSDIDLLCVIKKEVLHQNEVSTLHDIVTCLHKKYQIKIHLRVRNLLDLYTKESGFFDCGFTSSINKLRDNILIYGNSLDSEYLRYIKNVNEEEYVLNLKIRYSNLKYQNRALISLENDFDNNNFESMMQYKCSCILFQLAELICYTYGLHFTSSLDALSKAYEKTKNSYFKTASNIKQGNEIIVMPHFVATIDELIKNHAQKIAPNHLTLLKRIVLHDTSIFNKNNQIGDESEKIIEPYLIKYKRNYITHDGTLHILKNNQYEFNK